MIFCQGEALLFLERYSFSMSSKIYKHVELTPKMSIFLEPLNRILSENYVFDLPLIIKQKTLMLTSLKE